MRLWQRLVRKLCVVLLAAAVLASCGAPSGTVDPDTHNYSGEIRIGYAGPLTGDQAAVGIDLWHGAELAALHYNQRGGVLGRKVVIVPLDDEADGEVAVEVARQFVEEEHVEAVVGHYSSGATLPASEIYAQAGLVQVTTMASNPVISQQGLETFFRVCPIDSVQGPLDAEFAVNTLGARRISIVHIGGDTYSEGLRDEFSARARSLGAEIVGTHPYEDGVVDFSGIVDELKSEQPDLVFFSGYYPGGDILLRQMREAGLEAPFLSGDGSFEYGFLREAGRAAEGAYISSLFPDVLATSAMEPWVQEFRQQYRYQPGINSPAGYAAAVVILEGIEAAGTTDGYEVARAIRSLDIETPYGTLRYDENGDLIEQDIPMFVVEDGQFVEWGEE
ncbi:MAG: branched-chain amino acid ABC transporter substrate-binding protein [Chloroflexia bacterium]|nr:branched-chain amino acid ABC transporter substrate-binding protein [Chloroflexia bacterium]